MKLGLCLQKIFNGEDIVYRSDNGELEKYVVDMRTEGVARLAIATDVPFRFVVFRDRGVFVGTGMTLSGGRAGDYLAAWLFLPEKVVLNIKANIVIGWLDSLDNLLGAYALEPSKETLANFDSFYKKMSSPSEASSPLYFKPSALSNGTDEYAVLSFKKSKAEIDDKDSSKSKVNTLETLLSPEYIYQPGYEKYKGIMLIDEDYRPIECQLEDLTTNPLRKSILVCIKKDFPKDIKVDIIKDDGKPIPFEKPIHAFEGDKLNVEYNHASGLFLPITSTYTVSGDGQLTPPTNLEWEFLLDAKSVFVVVDNDNGKKVEATVSLNGNALDSKRKYKKSEAKEVNLEVKAVGYKTFRKKISLLDANGLPRPVILIQLLLHKEMHLYGIKLKDGTYYDIERSEPEGKWESPLNGFVIDEKQGNNSDRRHLIRITRLTDKGVQKFVAIAAIVGLLLGLLLGWLLFAGNSSSQPNATNPTNVQTIIQ